MAENNDTIRKTTESIRLLDGWIGKFESYQDTGNRKGVPLTGQVQGWAGQRFDVFQGEDQQLFSSEINSIANAGLKDAFGSPISDSDIKVNNATYPHIGMTEKNVLISLKRIRNKLATQIRQARDLRTYVKEYRTTIGFESGIDDVMAEYGGE